MMRLPLADDMGDEIKEAGDEADKSEDKFKALEV